MQCNVCVCVYVNVRSVVCVCICVYPQSKEGTVRFSRVGIAGCCEPLMWVLGTEAELSESSILTC